MDPQTSRKITRDYWLYNGWAAAALVSGTAMNGWDTPSPGHYFLAGFFVVYAHARRNHRTMLALDAKKGQR